MARSKNNKGSKSTARGSSTKKAQQNPQREGAAQVKNCDMQAKVENIIINMF